MSNAKNAIENAEIIIERFGGIRPMAAKINVAVTTIQGWKKRGVIPAKRRDEIIKAAENHDIDIIDLLGASPAANENTSAKTSAPAAPASSDKASETAAATPEPTKQDEATIEEAIQEAIKISTIPSNEQPADKAKEQPEIIHSAAMHDALKAERQAAKTTSWITTAIVLAALTAVALILWPQANEVEENAKRLSQIEENVNAVKSEVTEIKNNGSFFGNMIPTDLEDRISSLQEQAGLAQEKVGEALKKAEAISNDVLSENAGTIEDRIVKLEQHANVFASASPELTDMVGRLKSLHSTLGGQAQLDQSVSELNALVGNLSGDVNTLDNALGGETSSESLNDLLHSSLITAKEQSPTLGQTFEGVPPENMKAAAILLGFSQFRSALHRDNAAFNDDLALLSNLIGDDNPELQGAIAQLAPHANDGVLSSSGLSKEFRSIAGDLVVSSLKGEDVSITEKAQAHFNEILTVEKNGKMISGTPTQQTVAEAQSMLDSGDVAGAIAALQSLEGEQAQITAPFLQEAQTTLLAQQVESMLGQSFKFDDLGLGSLNDMMSGNINVENLNAGNIQNTLGNAVKGATSGSSGIIRDEKTGITILKP